MSTLADQLAFLEALRRATERGAITWRMIEDDERDMCEASVDGEAITVERLMLRGADGQGSERVFVRLVGMNLWEVFAIGTEGYERIMSMLGLSILGWKDGQDGHAKSLRNATGRVRALLPSQ
jgi:hypothetical protein